LFLIFLTFTSIVFGQDFRRVDVDRKFWRATTDTHMGIYPFFHEQKPRSIALRADSLHSIELIKLSTSDFVPKTRFGWIFRFHPSNAELAPSASDQEVSGLVFIPAESLDSFKMMSIQDLADDLKAHNLKLTTFATHLDQAQRAEFLRIVFTYAVFYNSKSHPFVFTHAVLLTSEILTHGRAQDFSLNPFRLASQYTPSAIPILLHARGVIRPKLWDTCRNFFAE
jgi:hypothetical protein